MFLAFGVLAALWERQRSGVGQVVDAAIVDGVTSLMTYVCGTSTYWANFPRSHGSLLGGAAPFYRCYLCADGKEISRWFPRTAFLPRVAEEDWSP